jgi:hypothetical protein
VVLKKIRFALDRAVIALKNKYSNINKQPVFILGNDKSGTTVIAATLAHATGNSIVLDIPPIWNPTQLEIHNSIQNYNRFIDKNRYYFSKDIIKEPVLTFEYEVLKSIFPKAKFVLIIRNPFENIRSILNRLQIPGNISGLEHTQVDFNTRFWKSWETVLTADWMGHKNDNFIGSMAYRWNWIIDMYHTYIDDITLVKYEDFKADSEEFINKLCAELEVEVVHDFKKISKTQFQPKGKRVQIEEFFNKENYALIDSITKRNRFLVEYD